MNELTSILEVFNGHPVHFRQVDFFITKGFLNESENESGGQFIFSALILTR